MSLLSISQKFAAESRTYSKSTSMPALMGMSSINGSECRYRRQSAASPIKQKIYQRPLLVCSNMKPNAGNMAIRPNPIGRNFSVVWLINSNVSRVVSMDAHLLNCENSAASFSRCFSCEYSSESAERARPSLALSLFITDKSRSAHKYSFSSSTISDGNFSRNSSEAPTQGESRTGIPHAIASSATQPNSSILAGSTKRSRAP